MSESLELVRGDKEPEVPALNKPRRAFIKSYGCQMNVYDSERMGDILALEGYDLAQSAEAADLVLLNTCHIRERASEKIFSELGRLRALKEARAAERSPTSRLAAASPRSMRAIWAAKEATTKVSL